MWYIYSVFQLDNFHCRELTSRIKILDSLSEIRLKTTPEEHRNVTNAIRDHGFYATANCVATASTPGVIFQVPGHGIFTTIFGTVLEPIKPPM
jgi:hypothetical protein